MRYQFIKYVHSGARKYGDSGIYLYPITIELYDTIESKTILEAIEVPVHGSVTNAETDSAINATLMSLMKNKYGN